MTTEHLTLENAVPLPLFYKNPVLLRFEEHKTAGLRRQGDFSFARAAIAVPLCVGEFAAAQRHYPIVFSADDLHSPLAVMGVKEGQNLFIDDNGNWKDGHYLPAYIRRYPFIVTDTSDRKAQLLTIDAASERFVADALKDKDAAQLFDDKGGPAPAAQKAMAFCHAVQAEHVRTTDFTNALTQAGLLTANHAQMSFPDGSRYTLDGFMVVDDEAYRKLPAKTLADWLGRDWLDLVALHRASRQNWQALLDLHALRKSGQMEAA